MPMNITMPSLSPTMEEGTLAKWLVKPGNEASMKLEAAKAVCYV